MESDDSGSEDPGTPGADAKDSQRERNIAESLRKDCLGVARLRLSAFSFELALAKRHRPLCLKNVERLERVFALQGCQRFYTENFVDVAVAPTTPELAVQRSQIHPDSLYKPQDVPLLELGSVNCLHGLHRIRAADHFFEDESERWWVARLYSAPSDEESRRLIDAFTNAQPYTDGEIFWNIRYYTTKERDVHAQLSWLSRLTRTKQKSLKRLLKKPGFSEAFDKLLDMPGMWRPIKLGALNRLLGLGCDEEMLRYLKHVHTTWRQICGNLCIVRPDVETVRRLELLCPRLASEDADKVCQLMRDRLIFCDVEHTGQRSNLQRRILNVATLIPTLWTFFENLKYLEPCCVIMKSLVKVDYHGTKTIRRAYRKSYTPPQRAFVDFTEDERRAAPGSGSNIWRSASYLQLWLYSMRHFPEISTFRCRKESKKPKPGKRDFDATLVCGFARLAIDLGFPTKRARISSANDPDTTAASQLLESAQLSLAAKDPRFLEPIATALSTARRACRVTVRSAHPEMTCGGPGEPIARRCGMPFEDSHTVDREFLFLPAVTTEDPEMRRGVTSLFVKRDMFIAFFGRCGVNLSDAIQMSPRIAPPVDEPSLVATTTTTTQTPQVLEADPPEAQQRPQSADMEVDEVYEDLATSTRDKAVLEENLADALKKNDRLQEEVRRLEVAQMSDARDAVPEAEHDPDMVIERQIPDDVGLGTDHAERSRPSDVVEQNKRSRDDDDDPTYEAPTLLIIARPTDTPRGYILDHQDLPLSPTRRMEVLGQWHTKDYGLYDPQTFLVFTDKSQLATAKEIWAMTTSTRDIVARDCLRGGPRRVRGAMDNKTRRISSSYEDDALDPQSQSRAMFNSGEVDDEL